MSVSVRLLWSQLVLALLVPPLAFVCNVLWLAELVGLDQLGICGDTIVSFIYKSQLELEQVLESCRLQCPVPSKVIDRESAVKSTIPVQGSQHVEGSCKESAALGSEPGPLLQNQDVQSGKRRLSSLDDVERNEGEFGAKRNCRRSSNISPSQAEAGMSCTISATFGYIGVSP